MFKGRRQKGDKKAIKFATWTCEVLWPTSHNQAGRSLSREKQICSDQEESAPFSRVLHFRSIYCFIISISGCGTVFRGGNTDLVISGSVLHDTGADWISEENFRIFPKREKVKLVQNGHLLNHKMCTICQSTSTRRKLSTSRHFMHGWIQLQQGKEQLLPRKGLFPLLPLNPDTQASLTQDYVYQCDKELSLKEKSDVPCQDELM